MVNFSENIRTNQTGFIRQWSGLIRQQTGLIRRRIKPVRQRITPVHLVLIFLSLEFFFFSNVSFMTAERVLPSELAYKTAYSEILC